MLITKMREISEEIYERNKDRVYMSEEDEDEVFSMADQAYGVYVPRVVAGDDGKFYVVYESGTTCD